MLSRTIWRRALTLALITVVACEIPSRVSLSGNEATRLDVSPKLLTLQQNQAADFTAVGFTSTGDTADVAINWSTTSGSITDTTTINGKHHGRFKAGSDTGKVKIVVRGKSTSTVRGAGSKGFVAIVRPGFRSAWSARGALRRR